MPRRVKWRARRSVVPRASWRTGRSSVTPRAMAIWRGCATRWRSGVHRQRFFCPHVRVGWDIVRRRRRVNIGIVECVWVVVTALVFARWRCHGGTRSEVYYIGAVYTVSG